METLALAKRGRQAFFCSPSVVAALVVAWGRAAALTALESRFDCSFGNGAATACNPKEA